MIIFISTVQITELSTACLCIKRYFQWYVLGQKTVCL